MSGQAGEESSEGAGTEPGAGARSRRWWPPRPIAVGVIVGLAVVGGVGAYVLSGRGSSDERSCVTELAGHLPSGWGEWMFGSDFGRAYDAGFDEVGSLAESVDDEAIVVSPDPLSQRITSETFDPEAAIEQTGYSHTDISCWVGLVDGSFVARGDFDVERVEGSELAQDGDIATDGSVLAYAGRDPEALLEPQRALEDEATDLLATLDDHEVINFELHSTDLEPERVDAAQALAYDDGWEIVLVRLFPNDSAAEAARQSLVSEGDVLGSDDIVEGDPVDYLDTDGSMLVLRAPLSEPEGQSWTAPRRLRAPFFSSDM